MKKFDRRGGYFDLDGRIHEAKQLEHEVSQPDFWQNQNRARVVSKQLEDLRKEIQEWEAVRDEAADLLELSMSSDADDQFWQDWRNHFGSLEARYGQLEFRVLFSGKYDRHNCLISIHAGSGGTEAQDWAQMLLRMYLRFCERNGFESLVLDESRGQEAGIKSVTVEMSGLYAYGRLKSEAGVHRLVRISPFDAEKMRHTSFALVEVVPEIDNDAELDIREADLKIETMRASGHGGQGVNTTDSAVRVTHLPTGLVVKCQNERSQLQNKLLAIKILKSRLAKIVEERHLEKISEIRGEVLSAEWGNQIRSYVLQPYKMVKDHRTEYTSTDPDDVLEGNLDGFIESYLRLINKH